MISCYMIGFEVLNHFSCCKVPYSPYVSASRRCEFDKEEKSNLEDFVGPRCWEFFKATRMEGRFLSEVCPEF